MPDVTLPDPSGSGEEGALPLVRPEVLRGLASALGKLLVESWPAASQNSDVRWALVALAELANALLSGDDERAAWLLDELDRQAER